MYDTRVEAMITLPDTELTFEQVLHPLEAGIETVGTGVGTGATKTYAYEFPLAETLNTIKTYTIEAGNVVATSDVREMEYAFVESMTFSGVQGEAWKMSSTWRGRQVSESVFTVGATLPTGLEEAIFANTLLFIDPSGGTLGATQKTGVLQAATINITTGIEGKFTGDGVLYFAAHAFRKPEITFSLTMQLEDGGAFKAERDAYEAKSIRLITLRCDGTSSRRFTQWFAGRYSSVGAYEDSDGNTTVTLEGRALLSSTDTLFYKTTVVNLLTTVP